MLTIFTSMFLHGGWLHVGGNMLYLWIFGKNVEDSMGHGRFLAFYLLCGMAAAATQYLSNPASAIPMIGASGAVSGTLGAYVLLHPHAKIWTLVIFGFFVRTIPVPAFVVLGFWVVLQIANSLLTFARSDTGGVAFLAHVGGFICGLLLIGVFRRSEVRRRRRWA
jgi:membrane associated rhomboid family serine protease